MEYLIEYMPKIKTRLYSIASCNEFSGDKIELCIIYNDWVDKNKKYRHGITTHHLR